MQEDLGPDGYAQRIGRVMSGGIGQGMAKRASPFTVGTNIISLTLPDPDDNVAWHYLRVLVLHDTATVTVAINEDPSNSAADPPSATQWGVGYDVAARTAEMIPLRGTITTVRIVSDTTSTTVTLNLVP